MVCYYILVFFLTFSIPVTVSQERGTVVPGGLVFSGNYNLPAGNPRSAKLLPPGRSTTLHLTKDDLIDLESNYSISFIAYFRNNFSSGNILCVKNPAYTINLRFTGSPGSDSALINLLFNGKPAGVSFAFPQDSVHEGKPFSIKLDVDEIGGSIALSLDGKAFTQEFNPFKTDESSDIYFGSPPGQTDCAPMTVQDLRISIAGETTHRYLFNETDGNIAYDSEGGLDAYATNHEWLINRHYFWNIHDSTSVNKTIYRGIFRDPYNNELGILTNEGIEYLSFKDGSLRKVKYRDTQQPINYVHHYPNQDLVLGYSSAYPDDEAASFDFKKGILKGRMTKVTHEGHYYGGRILVNTGSDAVNIFGGYGWYKTKNKLIRFDPATRKWNELKITGDFFTPRHNFAVLPSEEKDVYYFLGGIGNRSGNQGDGYYHIWDIFRFNLDSLTMKKVYDWGRKESYQINYEAVWANENRTEIYTALRPYGYEEGVAKAMGRLNFSDTVLTLVGDTGKTAGFYPATGYLLINYEISRLFSVIPAEYDSTVTIKVLSIKTPLLSEAEYRELHANSPNVLAVNRSSNWSKWGIPLAAVLFLPLASIYIIRYRKKKKKVKNSGVDYRESNTPKAEKKPESNLVTIFGGLRINDTNGLEITRKLTRKQYEVLSFTAYHTFRSAKGKGVEIERLDTMIWHDTPHENIKNTRNVTLSKIRTALKGFEGVSLIVNDNSISLKIDEKYHNEIESYFMLKRHLSGKEEITDEESINSFIRYASRGRFFGPLTEEWVDDLRSKEESEIIAIVTRYLNRICEEGKFDRCLEVIDSISVHDPLNEELLGIRLRSLYNLGRHSIALEIFNSYCKEYEAIIGAKYHAPLQDLLKS